MASKINNFKLLFLILFYILLINQSDYILFCLFFSPILDNDYTDKRITGRNSVPSNGEQNNEQYNEQIDNATGGFEAN